MHSNTLCRCHLCAPPAFPSNSTPRQAIESPKESRDDTQWLCYWSILGMVSLVEGKVDDALRSIPFYYHVKLGLLVWLQMQVMGGSLKRVPHDA